MVLPDDEVFKLLANKADEAFFVYRADTDSFTYLSPAFVNMAGITSAEITNQPDRLLAAVHPDDRDYLQSHIKILNDEGKAQAEFRIVIGEEARYVRLSAYKLHSSADLVAGWITDINTLKNNILYAEKINARKNSLLEIVAHDLKEPVGMINMMASAIKNRPGVVGDETIQSYVRIIQQLCESNIQLIRSLVHQEFLEAQEIALRLERIELVWAVRDVTHQYQISESLLNKEFRFHSETTQLYVVIDALKIMQTVNNLISNAIKFTPDGGLIEVTVTDLGSISRITVSDNGIGIPEELRPALFEPHTRAQRPGLRGEPGSGMGLSIIKTLTELHGGRIWLDTTKETGTTFHIDLPK